MQPFGPNEDLIMQVQMRFIVQALILFVVMCDFVQADLVRVDIPTSKKCLYSEYARQERVENSKKAVVTWTGTCKGGYISGQGVLTRKDFSGEISTFKGAYDGGLENGFVEGRWENANRIKTVKALYKDGYIVQGEEEFINLRDGSSRSYVGEYSVGEITGKGVLNFKGKQVRKGSFVKAKLNGYGEVIYSDGSYEKGYFRNDELNGQGLIHYANGVEVSSNYVNGEAQGQSTLRHPNGETKTGNMVNGGFDGIVDLINGNLYGQLIYKDGQMVKVVDGSGVFINQNNSSNSLYSDSCPCPYSIARDGSTCGARSAYSRAGGTSPQCY